MIEEYFDGIEYATDGFVYKNKVIFYYIAQKEKTKKSNYLVAHLYKQNNLNIKNSLKIKSLISRSLKFLNYNFGPFHAEFLFNKKINKFHIIEIHPRGAGYDVGSKFIKKISGTDLQQLELNYLLGREIKFNDFLPKIKYKNFCIRFLPIDKSGKIKSLGFKKFKISNNIHVIKKIFYKKGSEIKNGVDDSHRLCYLMLFSNNKKTNLVKKSENILKKYFQIKYYE